MYQVVEELMARMNALKEKHTEIVYSYHVDLDASSRLSDCEMNIRVTAERAVLTAVLPVAVRPQERYGVACELAKYNRSRLENKQEGMLELNVLRGRIQFMLEVKSVTEQEELTKRINYCLSEVQRYSEAMMNLVCDESNAIYEAEREKLERERKAAERAERTREYKNMPIMGKLMNLLGLIDEDEEKYEPVCLEVPTPVSLTETTEEKSEDKPEEKREEKTAEQK